MRALKRIFAGSTLAALGVACLPDELFLEPEGNDVGGATSVGGTDGETSGGGNAGTGATSVGAKNGAGGGGTQEMGGDSDAGAGGSSGGTPPASCPTNLPGPLLVQVPAPAGAQVPIFCVDSTEVTNAQYEAFLAADYPTSEQDPWCSWNTTYTPASNWPVEGKETYPVVYVDWCDAFAFCKWAGKHLCGKIGGGANPYSEFNEADTSEWYRACSRDGANTYPYGSNYDGTACNGFDNGAGATLPVGSKPTCEGGYTGLFDLNGNVQEWEDSCDDTTGPSDACRLRGGGFSTFTGANVSCDADSSSFASCGDCRDDSSISHGFRCCASGI